MRFSTTFDDPAMTSHMSYLKLGDKHIFLKLLFRSSSQKTEPHKIKKYVGLFYITMLGTFQKLRNIAAATSSVALPLLT